MEVPVTPFLTRPQLAERWFMARRTLDQWAQRGEGPAYRVIGARVLYRLEDVEAWEAEQWARESGAAGPKPAAKRTTTAATKTTAGRRGSGRAGKGSA
jgi:predicted DNA-binding transcriptional regulator AlpA